MKDRLRFDWSERFRGPIEQPVFVRGLMAALKLAGNEFIVVQNDNHQERYSDVMTRLEELRRARDARSARIPTWHPSAFTGRYSELDNTLLELQDIGHTSVVGPFFSVVELTASIQGCHETLQTFFEPYEEELMHELASVFANTPESKKQL